MSCIYFHFFAIIIVIQRIRLAICAFMLVLLKMIVLAQFCILKIKNPLIGLNANAYDRLAFISRLL